MREITDIFDDFGQSYRPAGAACSQNRDCESNFCDAYLRVCVAPCCTDTSCPAGLSCEKQDIDIGQGVVDARICVSQTTDAVWEKL